MSFEGFDTSRFKENLKKMDGQGGWKISEEEEKFAGTGHYEERLISGRTQKTARILRKSGEPFTVDDKLPLEASCHIRSIHDVDMGRQTFTVRWFHQSLYTYKYIYIQISDFYCHTTFSLCYPSHTRPGRMARTHCYSTRTWQNASDCTKSKHLAKRDSTSIFARSASKKFLKPISPPPSTIQVCLQRLLTACETARLSHGVFR